ncbi:MGDG synthase family glycosyltransferase [Streptomyces sp. RPT161]|uniref:MGDG synthase family glycosyltransferase n=1 Tax=Streptomyces sp. RPT161 TaxID=3015993 RepID=UPI0022B88A58|nr:glycosyltransferase [Streptomyces sp. RPT161]
MALRFVILSARMGAGHDTVAAELARRLARRGHRTETIDVLDLLPARLGVALRAFYATVIRHVPVVYDAIYRAYFVPPPDGNRQVRDTTPIVLPAARALRRRLAADPPDAVVSTFHLGAQICGRLREEGVLRVPSAVVITDFAVHRQWVHPGNDLHLCPTPQTAQDVRRMGGQGALAVGPVVADAFHDSADPAGVDAFARAAPGRPVLLSTGAWGVGSQLAETAALLSGDGWLPVVLCGRRRALRWRLDRVPGTVALGWVDDVPALMAAVDVLVMNAAGQTAAQALAAGVPVVGYRPIAGHGVHSVRRMAESGLCVPARSPQDLLRTLRELAFDGPVRQARIDAGRALFTADAADVLATAARTGAPR